jgi:hypothetical protein
VIDQNLKPVRELSELSVVEMEQVEGGVDTCSLNFGAIKFEYKPQKSDGTLG